MFVTRRHIDRLGVRVAWALALACGVPETTQTMAQTLAETVAPIPATQAASSPAPEHSGAWRCGQTLTNKLPVDEQARRNCQPLALPLATTVATGTAVRPAASAAAPNSSNTATPLAFTVQVQPQEQKQRDAQARQLLLAEKQRLQGELQSARQNGNASAQDLLQADLASIDRELIRLGAKP
jgi:hypothetical protein